MTADPDLNTAIAAWCDSQKVKILRDDTKTITAVLPSLLAQLQAAVGSGSNRQARRSTGGRCPANLDAIDLLDRLRIVIADHTGRLAAHLAGPRLRGGWMWRPATLPDRLRRLPDLPWPAGDDTRLARILTRLAATATDMLSPKDIPAWRQVRDTPCPRCGYRTLLDVDDDGEPVRVPPLVVAFDGAGHVSYVTCAACWAGWWRTEVPDLWDELAAAAPWHAELDGARTLRSGPAGQGGDWLTDVPA